MVILIGVALLILLPLLLWETIVLMLLVARLCLELVVLTPLVVIWLVRRSNAAQRPRVRGPQWHGGELRRSRLLEWSHDD